MQHWFLTRDSIRPASQPPARGLRLSLAQGAAAALAALVLVWSSPPAAAADRAASHTAQAHGPAPLPSASGAAERQWPQGTWSGLHEPDASPPTRVILTLNGSQDGQLRLEQRRCSMGLKPLKLSPDQIRYVIGPLKGGAPGMGPACDRLWEHTLVLSPGDKPGDFRAQIQTAKGSQVLDVVLSNDSVR